MSDVEMVKDYDVSKTPFDWGKLDGLLAYKSSLKTCSSILQVAENTLQKHIRKRHGQSWAEYSDGKLSPTKVKLVQKALEMAFSGDRTMLIFSLKNICQWQDKIESTHEVGKSVVELAYKINNVNT